MPKMMTAADVLRALDDARDAPNPDALRLAEAVNRDALRALEARRVAAGTCRHCGGPLPCWSPYGDLRPGQRRPR